jgi:WhiB family redox-sensing transcriptional regulator
MSARAVVLAWRPVPPQPADVPWDWTALAACQYTDPDAFFPDRGESPVPAKRVCGSCEVRAECLEYALENRIPHGVFGGTTERQRRVILAARERESGALRCESRRHLLTGENVLPNGKCAACREAAFRSAEGRRVARGLAA